MNSEALTRIARLPAEQRLELLQRLSGNRRREADPGVRDVVVVGGGTAGMTLALQLREAAPSARIVVLERESFPVPEVAHKVGESTVEIAAHYLRDIIGLGDHLASDQLRKYGLRMFFSDDHNVDLGTRVELGSSVYPPLTTYQLDRGRLENCLYRNCADADIEIRTACKVEAVVLGTRDDPHRVQVRRDSMVEEIRARWVVDASGRRRLLQRQLGLGRAVGHRANAAWFRVTAPIDIKDWTADPAWQARLSEGDRALSTNHLMGPGYWVWMIRLASDAISIGIVADAATHPFESFNQRGRALAWLREHEPQCAAAIDQHAAQIQDFKVMRDYSYGCEQVYSGEGRWCLTGEAAVFLDPLYSPGLDMIAIGNGLICDLIARDLRGEDVTSRAAIHDRLFLRLADIWLTIYEGQYGLLGNARVMSAKVIWDTAFYWGVFCLLFFHDAFATMIDRPRVAESLGRLTEISNRVQVFFREWDRIEPGQVATPFVDLYAPLNFMVDLHAGIDAELNAAQLDEQFEANVTLFEQLAGQLVATVIESQANRPGAEDSLAQIQRWQTDALLRQFMAAYRRQHPTNPTSDGWLRLSVDATPAPRPELVGAGITAKEAS
jgi:2-polyprenyl-6-methoxyphenol hydroxylase-like FAD-dependent oxidoreductase